MVGLVFRCAILCLRRRYCIRICMFVRVCVCVFVRRCKSMSSIQYNVCFNTATTMVMKTMSSSTKLMEQMGKLMDIPRMMNVAKQMNKEMMKVMILHYVSVIMCV